jgi:hypothetical protein
MADMDVGSEVTVDRDYHGIVFGILTTRHLLRLGNIKGAKVHWILHKAVCSKVLETKPNLRTKYPFLDGEIADVDKMINGTQ